MNDVADHSPACAGVFGRVACYTDGFCGGAIFGDVFRLQGRRRLAIEICWFRSEPDEPALPGSERLAAPELVERAGCDEKVCAPVERPGRRQRSRPLALVRLWHPPVQALARRG